MADRGVEWAPSGIDVTVPSVAWIYDYVLGGKDNFAVDREVADAIVAVARRQGGRAGKPPFSRPGGRVSRRRRSPAVSRSGHRPAESEQCARGGAAGAFRRPVVYVDNDPAVLAHARALLAKDDSTVVVREDIRDPERILANPVVRGMIDFSEPVAVMFVAVLHFVTDDEDPWAS